jgi:hypothetical protein
MLKLLYRLWVKLSGRWGRTKSAGNTQNQSQGGTDFMVVGEADKTELTEIFPHDPVAVVS